MRTLLLLILFLTPPLLTFSQTIDEQKAIRSPQHYISVNPLNMLLFQQLGVTYEYRPGMAGFGISAGYIYPNHKTYSNYFIAGPTDVASLGDYSGLFLMPQVNLYVRNPRNPKHGGSIYLSLKMVYKYMHLDSTYATAFYNEGDGYYDYRRMNDNVNIYGVFADFGYKYVFNHFFFDLNCGFGSMWLNHKMIIHGQTTGMYADPMYYLDPPVDEELHQNHVSANFSFTLGAAF